jgi:hypothetical protein
LPESGRNVRGLAQHILKILKAQLKAQVKALLKAFKKLFHVLFWLTETSLTIPFDACQLESSP